VNWIHLAQDRNTWRALINAAILTSGSAKGEEFLYQLTLKKDSALPSQIILVPFTVTTAANYSREHVVMSRYNVMIAFKSREGTLCSYIRASFSKPEEYEKLIL
jgi:hypothetical protein